MAAHSRRMSATSLMTNCSIFANDSRFMSHNPLVEKGNENYRYPLLSIVSFINNSQQVACVKFLLLSHFHSRGCLSPRPFVSRCLILAGHLAVCRSAYW